MDITEIQNKCFFTRRFCQSAAEVSNRYPDNTFQNLFKESLEEIIKIAENSDKSDMMKSEHYAAYFTEETGISLIKGNPFYIVLFSRELSINFVYILLEECRNWGYIPLLTRGIEGLKESHIVCALDLFDASKNCSFFKPKK